MREPPGERESIQYLGTVSPGGESCAPPYGWQKQSRTANNVGIWYNNGPAGVHSSNYPGGEITSLVEEIGIGTPFTIRYTILCNGHCRVSPNGSRYHSLSQYLCASLLGIPGHQEKEPSMDKDSARRTPGYSGCTIRPGKQLRPWIRVDAPQIEKREKVGSNKVKTCFTYHVASLNIREIYKQVTRNSQK